MTDNIPEIEEDESEAEKLKAVAEQIAQLMGGSAEDYALEQLGNGMFAMVFNDDSAITPELLQEKLQAFTVSMEIPEGASYLNVFGETTSRMLH